MTTTTDESLVTCPDCGQPNFSPRGLTAHRGNGHCRKRQADQKSSPRPAAAADAGTPSVERHEPSAPGKLSVVAGDAVPGGPPAGDSVPSHKAREITLADLDVMPVAPLPKPVALAAMSGAQLGEAMKRLLHVEESCERLSGIVCILSGLVLIEAKRKLAHGEFLPWLKVHFSKTRKTSAEYMRLAVGFSKCNPALHFEALEQDLALSLETLEENRLDLAHPVVAKVAEYTQGKSASQLLLDLGGTSKSGGDRHPKCSACAKPLRDHSATHCSHCGAATGVVAPSQDAQRALAVERVREWAGGHLADTKVAHKLWRLLPDHEAEALAAHFAGLVRDIRDWIKLPPQKRAAMSLEEALG